jgi:quercetin dioxygenase-like cupin family protein
MGGTVRRGHNYCRGMEIISFGPSLSRSINDHESRGFTVTPLIWSEYLSAVCIRLEPGGVIGRHEAASRQLFAVVAGSAFVSGDDGVERALTVGEAAIWQSAEMHETRSEEGLVAIALEGDF